MMLNILELYDNPPKLRSAISRMYQDFKVVLDIGKKEDKMSQTVGVIQGDCMTPVMFLFMVIVTAETYETEWIKSDLKMVNLKQQTHSPCDVDKLTGHNKNNFEQCTLLALFCVLYVDDGAFTFEDRDQLTRGLNLVYQHFTRFGLKMHIGKGNETFKIECVSFPMPGFLRQKLNLSTLETPYG